MDIQNMHATSHSAYHTRGLAAMDRYSGPTTYASHSLPQTSSLYSRPPLSDTSGNGSYKPIILPDITHRSKPAYHSLDYSPPKYKPRPVPSQPTELQRRRSYLRNARFNSYPTFPREDRRISQDARPSKDALKRLIASAPEYDSYRKKCKDKKDAVWPAELEDHFLDALLQVPTMGRVKWCIDKRPGGWGRNMIIGLYLDIAYFNKRGSRTPAQKEKARKQVSSHIQVLKAKMGHYSWFEWVIPSKPADAEALSKEEKDAEAKRVKATLAKDPCIAALKRGTLPHTTYLIRPWSFDLWMSLSNGACYNFTQPNSLKYYPEPSMEGAFSKLRRQFPQIQQVSAASCDIIHMRVDLALPDPINEAELHGVFKISVPADETHLDWRCMVTFNRHKDLCGPPEDDPPIMNHCVAMRPVDDKEQDGNGCLMRVHFPAIAWAYALSKLSAMNQYGAENGSAAEHIRDMTMYQEISSSTGNGQWEKRAIFAWTFEKYISSPHAEQKNVWSYVTVNPSRNENPSRHEVFEPHPGKQHEVEAIMTDNFNNLYPPNQSNTLSIQPIQFDCLSYGPTPPLTATSQSPYNQYQYPSQPDLLADDYGSMSAPVSQSSHHPSISESDHTSQQIDHYLQSQTTDEALSMSFDHNNQIWHAQPQNANYEDMDNFLPPLNLLPPMAAPGQNWDGGNEMKGPEQWAQNGGVYVYEAQNYGGK